MRTFNENERAAMAAALRTFIREQGGVRRTQKTLARLIDEALDAGLTADEIFNRANYERAFWLLSNSEVRKDLTPEGYIDLLIKREIIIRPLTEEPDWCDGIGNMTLLSRTVHDFYIRIRPKGGTWNTENARLNLEEAVRKHTLQAIMSEDLIRQVEEAERKRKGTEDALLTLFNYILQIRRHASLFSIDTSLTQEQERRREEERQASYRTEKDEEESLKEDNTAETGPEKAEEAEDTETGGNEKTPNVLMTETAAPEDDPDIFVTEEDEGEEGDFDFARQEPEREQFEPAQEAFIGHTDPSDYKRESIASLIFGFSIEEIADLSALTPETRSLDELIDRLTTGEVDQSRENVKTRQTHQFLNGELMQNFIHCIRMQGFPMDEETAMGHDPLLENWDFRDDKTRKLYKLKQLVYRYGQEDEDLSEAVKDLEGHYQTCAD